MYVVAVNGQAMTDGSPGHASAVVTRYAQIVNPDGSGKGNVSCLGDFCGLSGPHPEAYRPPATRRTVPVT